MVSINRLARPLMRGLFILALSIAPVLAQSATVSAATGADGGLGATLTILGQPVEVGQADGAFNPAVDGQRLYAGDVVRTGPGGVAVLTYFDGSESQLGADSQVLIEQAQATPAPQISFMQTAGVTVNHVVPLPPGGSFRTNTPTVTGLVRGTSYIVSVATDSSGKGPAASTGDVPATSSVTSVVLLTDRDGHVGRVDVARPASGEPTVRLAGAGEAVAGSATTAPTRAQLDPSSVARLESAANARKDLGAARETDRGAHALEQAMAPVLAAAPRTGDRQGDPATSKAAPAAVLVLPTPSAPQTTQSTPTAPEVAKVPEATPAPRSGLVAASASAPAPSAESASTSAAAAAAATTTTPNLSVEQKASDKRRPNGVGGSGSSSAPSTSAPAPSSSASAPSAPPSSASAPSTSAPASSASSSAPSTPPSSPAATAPSGSSPSAPSSAPKYDARPPPPSQPSPPAAAVPAPAPAASAPTQPAPQASAPPVTSASPAPPPPASPPPPPASPAPAAAVTSAPAPAPAVAAPPAAAPAAPAPAPAVAAPPAAAPAAPATNAAPTLAPGKDSDKDGPRDTGAPPPDHP